MFDSKLKPFTTSINLNTLYSYSNTWFHYFVKCLNLCYFPYDINFYKNGLQLSFTLAHQYSLLLISSPILITHMKTLFHTRLSGKNIGLNSHNPTFKFLSTFSSNLTLPTSKGSVKNNGFNYTSHLYFFFYKKHFNTNLFPLYTPVIKKKNRSFPFLSKLFSKKSLKPSRFSNKLMAHRKLWFITTLLKLNKKIKLIDLTKKASFKRFLKTFKLTRDAMIKRKNYLIPRQYGFLNGTRLSLKGKKALKTVLLRRIVRFYRRKLRRINTSPYVLIKLSKNLKYKFHLLTLAKRNECFNIPSLRDTKFYQSNPSLARIVRRGKSRLKLRRTKKYYSSLIRLLPQSSSNLLYLSFKKQYQFSRTRYLNKFFRNHARRYKLNILASLAILPTGRNSDIINTRYSIPSELIASSSMLNEYKGISYNYWGLISNINHNSVRNSFGQTFGNIVQFSDARSFLRNIDSNPHVLNTQVPAILSKYKAPFILSPVGFVFIQNIYNQTSTYIKSSLNRFRYSFFFKKDLKRYLLKKPGKLKLLASNLLFTNYRSHENFSSTAIATPLISNMMSSNLESNSLLSSQTLLTSQNPFFSYKYCRQYDHLLGNFVKKEVRMKRIKFKPGYSRIWRSARQAVNTALNLNTRYQYRLTRQLHRLQHLTKQTQAYLFDLTLKNVLLNSHFVHDHNTSLLMIKNGLVFVNGLVSSNPNLNLFQNDFIQLIISLKYYIVYRWLLNWTAAKRIRLRKLSKTKFKKFKVMTNKQRSQNLPDWILTSRLKSFDIPKYLEVDFFSLSSFILYEPFVLNDLNPLHFLDSRSEILNMYNWKYIN